LFFGSFYLLVKNQEKMKNKWVIIFMMLFTDFEPFDLEGWWGRRLYHTLTQSI